VSVDPSQYAFDLAETLSDLALDSTREFKKASWESLGSARHAVEKAIADDNLDVKTSTVELREIAFSDAQHRKVVVLVVDVTEGSDEPPDPYHNIYVVRDGVYLGRSSIVGD
jgi:hypothetical protein